MSDQFFNESAKALFDKRKFIAEENDKKDCELRVLEMQFPTIKALAQKYKVWCLSQQIELDLEESDFSVKFSIEIPNKDMGFVAIGIVDFQGGQAICVEKKTPNSGGLIRTQSPKKHFSSEKWSLKNFEDELQDLISLYISAV